MKQSNQMTWVDAMNSIRNRAKEIIIVELICCRQNERQAIFGLMAEYRLFLYRKSLDMNAANDYLHYSA